MHDLSSLYLEKGFFLSETGKIASISKSLSDKNLEIVEAYIVDPETQEVEHYSTSASIEEAYSKIAPQIQGWIFETISNCQGGSCGSCEANFCVKKAENNESRCSSPC